MKPFAAKKVAEESTPYGDYVTLITHLKLFDENTFFSITRARFKILNYLF